MRPPLHQTLPVGGFEAVPAVMATATSDDCRHHPSLVATVTTRPLPSAEALTQPLETPGGPPLRMSRQSMACGVH